jgi:hypothetical protein
MKPDPCSRCGHVFTSFRAARGGKHRCPPGTGPIQPPSSRRPRVLSLVAALATLELPKK